MLRILRLYTGPVMFATAAVLALLAVLGLVASGTGMLAVPLILIGIWMLPWVRFIGRTREQTGATRFRWQVPVLIAALVAITSVALFAAHDRNRGWETSCGDFLDMTHAEQMAVMKKAGVLVDYYDEQAAYYDEGCRQDPSDRDDPIDYIQG